MCAFKIMLRGKKATAKLSAVPRLVSEEAETKYGNLSGKRVYLEKGFDVKFCPTLGLPDYIADVLSQRGWEMFGMHPNGPYLAVVFEFYSNFLDQEQETVVLRSKEVEITAAAINEFYGLQNFDDEYIPFAENITDEQFDQVLHVICVKGTRWNISRTGKRSCRRTALTPQAEVWYHFLRTRLMPTTHDQIVSQDRCILLYCILTRKSIDVGKCIDEELCFSAFTKKEGKLFFPSLLSGMFLKVDIPHDDAKTTTKNLAKMSQWLLLD